MAHTGWNRLSSAMPDARRHFLSRRSPTCDAGHAPLTGSPRSFGAATATRHGTPTARRPPARAPERSGQEAFCRVRPVVRLELDRVDGVRYRVQEALDVVGHAGGGEEEAEEHRDYGGAGLDGS